MVRGCCQRLWVVSLDAEVISWFGLLSLPLEMSLCVYYEQNAESHQLTLFYTDAGHHSMLQSDGTSQTQSSQNNTDTIFRLMQL